MSAASRATRPALIPLAWPLFSELLLGISVGLVGLALASRSSAAASGAFALANSVQATFFLLLRVISLGVSVTITQELGAGNRVMADGTARAALGASTWVGLVTAVAVASCARPLLALLSAPADVLPLAAPYLQLLALALGVDAYNASMAAVMRAHLRARDVLLNILAMHALHLVLCGPLMLGVGPLPGLGLPGYALAMLVSRGFGIYCHLSLWRRRLGLVPRGRDWWALERQRLRPVLHIGLPGAAEGLAYRIALMFTIAAVARMGTTALATQAYAMQLTYFTVLPGLSIGLATEILVGRLVGAGRLAEARRRARRSLVLGLSVSTGVAVIAALTARWTLTLFTGDPEILGTAQRLLWLTVLLEPGRTFNLVVINALRATGDARFPVAAGVLSMAVVMAGGAWLLGVHWGLGLAGVWIAYAADEWLRGIVMAVRWQRGAWAKHARASFRRVRSRDAGLAPR
jgi:putative MATE family efflux protein